MLQNDRRSIPFGCLLPMTTLGKIHLLPNRTFLVAPFFVPQTRFLGQWVTKWILRQNIHWYYHDKAVFCIGRRRNWPHLIDFKIENNFGTNINWKILGGSKSLGSETWNFGGVFRCFADNSVVDTVLLRAAADSAPALSLNWLSKRETEMKWNKWNMNIFLFIFAATMASTSGESVIGEVMTEFEQTRCFVFV